MSLADKSEGITREEAFINIEKKDVPGLYSNSREKQNHLPEYIFLIASTEE